MSPSRISNPASGAGKRAKPAASVSATLPTSGAKQAAYHLNVAPGDVNPWIVLVGDPDRARRMGGLLQRVDAERAHREFVTISGRHDGLPVTFVGTGIGCDNTEIAVIELAQVVENATLIRAGTCGGLHESLDLGDLVITSGAMRLENTSLAYVDPGFPAVAHHEVVSALVDAARAERAPHQVGVTATASGFYGAQGRSVPGFAAKDPELPKRLAAQGVLNFEMEASTLLTLAMLRGFRAGVVCTVFASRTRDRFMPDAERRAAEDRCIRVALGALHGLAAKAK
jgi:uridine phosphorylase